MKKKLALLLVFVLAMLCGMASAVVDPGEDFYYLDTADVLSTEAEGAIYFCNRLLEESCGGQIVVATLDSIGDEDIYDYAYELFNEWGIGSAEKNNGFLLLMAIEEDDYFALSGAGIDRIFSSAVLGKLNDEVLEPEFAQKNYEAGALKYFDAVLDRYADYYNLDLDLQDGKNAYEAYLSANSGARGMGGARSGGGYYKDAPDDYGLMDQIGETIGRFIFILIVVFLAFRFPWLGFILSSSGHHHHHSHHYRSGRTASRPHRSGGFGGARTGGFGGGRSGGGRSFGGGAGRGRR